MNALMRYLKTAQEILAKIEATQAEKIAQAAEICAETIAQNGLVHLFGSGHSRMAVEEIFPRYGSFPGFHPIVELALTFHTNVVGSNGQRQALFLENIEGYAEVILRNFDFKERDCLIVFSNSGANIVPIEMALGAKKRGLFTMAVTSIAHSQASKSKQRSGKKLFEVVDLAMDNCVPPGDATIKVDGLEQPVGPASSVATLAIVNAIKCQVAENLVKRGLKPLVLTSDYFMGERESKEHLERVYDDYKNRTKER